MIKAASDPGSSASAGLDLGCSLQQVEAPAPSSQLERYAGGKPKASRPLAGVNDRDNYVLFGGPPNFEKVLSPPRCFSLCSVFLNSLTSSHTLTITFQLFVSFLFVLSYRLRFQLSLRPPDSLELVNCLPPLRSYTLVISGDHRPLCPAWWSPHLQIQ